MSLTKCDDDDMDDPFADPLSGGGGGGLFDEDPPAESQPEPQPEPEPTPAPSKPAATVHEPVAEVSGGLFDAEPAAPAADRSAHAIWYWF